jgi:hypothetical protein
LSATPLILEIVELRWLEKASSAFPVPISGVFSTPILYMRQKVLKSG